MSSEPADSPEIASAVAAACELFWENGYEATSIEDVVQATGVNRYALYKAFGGKRELFLAAIDAYFEQGRAIVMAAFAEPGLSPVQAIRRVFAWGTGEMARRKSGCLICNLALEHSRGDPVIHERMESYLAQMRSGYAGALEKTRAQGRLNPNITPEEGADILMTLKLGLGERARAGAAFEEMMASVDAVLALLEAPKQSTPLA
ncbi:MAG: TetR/AcrR family transcriptional regulator [Amphiplicatus sp.]